ncbi:MAG: metal ABC transporter permease [Phycisphaerae bacterium]|jgi:manganese/zinc/iron transport system permease protein
MLVALCLACTSYALAAAEVSPAGGPPGDRRAFLRELAAVLTLRDYNTRVVVVGVSLLGAASGLVGSFMLLRKRALLSDAISHATLPGIGLAFIAAVLAGGTGKSLPVLLLGATVSGAAGVALVLLVVHTTRVKEDAALGIVLSVFFGLGIAITSLIQRMQSGHAAGLKSFIYGKTASMLMSDALLIAGAALVVALLCVALYKEFTLLCFDPAYGGSQGWPIVWIDVLLMAAVIGVTVIGLQAVGLILMVALMVIPAAAARFWTHHLPTMLLTAAVLGAASGYAGAAISALVPRMPAGAIIVLVAGAIFALSMLLGPARGVLARGLEHARLGRRVRRQHLMRALFELAEDGPPAAPTVEFNDLLSARTWSPRSLRRELARAVRDGLVRSREGDRGFELTDEGLAAARRTARNHRLWELYLIRYADVAPSHVDRDADAVEHVLGPEIIGELEAALAAEDGGAVPRSPHEIAVRPAPGGKA